MLESVRLVRCRSGLFYASTCYRAFMVSRVTRRGYPISATLTTSTPIAKGGTFRVMGPAPFDTLQSYTLKAPGPVNTAQLSRHTGIS